MNSKLLTVLAYILGSLLYLFLVMPILALVLVSAALCYLVHAFIMTIRCVKELLGLDIDTKPNYTIK